MARHADAAGYEGAEGAANEQIAPAAAQLALADQGAAGAGAAQVAPGGAEGAGGAAAAQIAPGGADGAAGLDPAGMTQDQIDARVLQIAEDLRIARNLAEQEDVDALWRIREEEDRLAAERAGRQAAARPRSPEVEVMEETESGRAELDRLRQEWPSLQVASQQGPKRRRSTTPAARDGPEMPAAAGAPEMPAAAAAPEMPAAANPSPGGAGVAGGANPLAAQSQIEFDEHVRQALAECARGAAGNPGARAVRFGDGSAPGTNPQPPPHQSADYTGAGSSNDPPSVPIPTKPMPRLPPAGVAVQPCAYRDFRLAAGSVPQPTPEFIAAFDQQMAAERAARLAAAWGSSPQLQRAAAANEPHSYLPKSPPITPHVEPPMPSAEAVEAFVAWQATQAGKDKGKGKPKPQPFAALPVGWGQKGKGKGLHGEQLAPRPPSVGRGHSRDRHHSRGREPYGKRSRDEMRDDRTPRPCKKCGAWYVCRTAPENLAIGARHGHCSNPNCERSWGARHGRELPVRDRPTQPDCIVIGGAAPIAPAAAAVPKATPAPAADAAHSDTDVSRSAPVTPNPQMAAQAGPPSAAAVPTAGQVEMVIDWAAVRLMNEQGYQRWLALHQPPAPAGPAPGTPEVVPAAAAVPIVAVPGYELRRVPVTPPDRPAATTTTT